MGRLGGVLMAVAGALVYASHSAAAANVCVATGEPAPDVPTLQASKTNPAKDAWVVAPDCSYQVVKGEVIDSGDVYLNTGGIAVERVAGLPSEIADLLINTGLSRGGDVSGASKLQAVHFLSPTTSVKDLVFPPSMRAIQLENVLVHDIDSLNLPSDLTALNIMNTKLQSLNTLKIPSKITSMALIGNKLTEIDFVLPPLLVYLSLDDNPISKLEGVVLPETLREFTCVNCPITSIKGVRFSDSLYKFIPANAPITTFEIRASDLARVNSWNNYFGPISQTACTDSSAKLVALTGRYLDGNVCVISDKSFDELYGVEVTSPPTASPSPTSSAAVSSSVGSAPSATTPPSGAPITPDAGGTTGTTTGTSGTSFRTTLRPSTSGTPSENGISTRLEADNSTLSQVTRANQTAPSSNQTSSSTRVSSNARNGSALTGSTTSTIGPERAATPGAGSQKGASTTANVTTSDSSTLVMILAVVGTAFVLLVLAIGYRAVIVSRKKKDSDTSSGTETYAKLETPLASSHSQSESHAPHAASQGYLANDIRNDALLGNFRIQGDAIKIGAPVAQGGFGIIYKGVVDGETVAVKQMLPDTWRDEATVASFMDEIRMCVSLDHPKIVSCVGISWSSLRDLSLVIEYMNGGDLHTVLESQCGRPATGREWSEPWTSSNIKSKMSIATDVTEALVYLHAFNNPIIHRDLKAKNVLLDTEGNAKLSDFGISREVSMDETMTCEIGTVAWIAPEVLRGDRYTEKADIYSLGVLLVELDRCLHPYAHEHVLASNEATTSASRGRSSIASGAVVKNTKIAILVSTGKLRPTPSATCPEDVRQLVGRCLAFEVDDRPTAIEVQKLLSQLHEKGT